MKQPDANRLRLAAIVECSDDAILSMTLDGKIVTWNQGAEKFYGYSASEMIGRHFITLVNGEHAAGLETSSLKHAAARRSAGTRRSA